MSPKSQAAGRRVVKAVSKSSLARTKLQFLLDIAQATFSQPGPPTKQQVEALKRTLSEYVMYCCPQGVQAPRRSCAGAPLWRPLPHPPAACG
jgi:hypothetical protein